MSDRSWIWSFAWVLEHINVNFHGFCKSVGQTLNLRALICCFILLEAERHYLVTIPTSTDYD